MAKRMKRIKVIVGIFITNMKFTGVFQQISYDCRINFNETANGLSKKSAAVSETIDVP